MLRHLAEVERNWFRRRFAGEADLPYLYVRPNGKDFVTDADFDDLDPTTAETAYATLVEEQRLSRAAIEGHSLDDTFNHHKFGPMSLRCLMQHMICEYARHNGQADLIRECIDGTKETQ